MRPKKSLYVDEIRKKAETVHVESLYVDEIRKKAETVDVEMLYVDEIRKKARNGSRRERLRGRNPKKAQKPFT
jgi:hypothetical protein